MHAALRVELLKLRRSRVPAATAAAVVLLPPLLAVAMVRLASRGAPDAVSMKAAALIWRDGWAGYLDAVTQIFGSAGLLGMGIVVAWCFAREYADRTVTSLYASAISREKVATAKLVALLGWCCGVSLLLMPIVLLVGLTAGLGAPDATDLAAAARLVAMAVLTGVLALTVSLFATEGRGYLPSFGGLILLIAVAQVAVIAGAGSWVPLSIPAWWAVSASTPDLPDVPAIRLLIVPVTVAAVSGLTVWRWRRAQVC